MARVGVLSGGHHTPAGSQLRLNYVAWLHVNPVEPEDFRAHLDGTVALHVAGPLSAQFSVNATYNSVVVVGVQTYDTRTVFGLSLSPPPQR